jgi:hypothetical protein
MAVTGSASANAGTLANNNPTYISSLFDYFTTPNIAEAFYKKFGQQSARLMFELMGRVFPVTGNYPFQAHEDDNRVHKAIKTHASDGAASAASGAGDSVTVRISTDDIDENGNYPVQEKQSAWIKQSDGSIPELMVTSVTENSTTDVDITLKPFNENTQLDAISNGTTIYLGVKNSGENMGQPEGSMSQMFVRNFYPFESKATAYLTGDAMNQEYWFERQMDGYSNLWNKAFIETESRMNIEEDMKAFMGEENGNSVTATDAESNSKSIHSAKGFWQWIDELGGKLDYGNDFSVEYLDEVQSFMESYHVTTGNLACLAGSGFGRKLNKTGLDFVQQYSSGTDFVDAMFGGDEEVAVKANIKAIQYGDMMIAYQPLSILTDQTQFGDVLNNSGIMFPVTTVTDGKTGAEYNNIGLGYEEKNGNSLKRIVNEYPGMTKSRGTVSSQYTSDKWFFRSKLIPFIMGVHSMLLVRDE